MADNPAANPPTPTAIDAAPAPACVTAPPGLAQRTDKFLAESFPLYSRARIQALLRAGHVRRDGQIITDAAEPARPGAVYGLAPPPPIAAQPQPQAIALDILFEDTELLVLDKPAGLVVHPAPGNADGTLVNALLAHCGDTLPGIGGERRPGIVHRLDKDTSGVMVVAKTEHALAVLGAAFAARDLDRCYLALCWGVPSPAQGQIEGHIGRDPKDRKRMAMVASGGKQALTRYATQRVWHGAVSLLECRLATGRTHQIRVHLAASGHPLIGDPVYLRRTPAASRALPAPLAARLRGFPRQALHAASLGFAHPTTGAWLQFAAPPTADFQALLEELTKG